VRFSEKPRSMRSIGFRVTRAKPGGNAGRQAAARAEISAAMASIAGAAGRSSTQKTLILLGFWHWHGAC